MGLGAKYRTPWAIVGFDTETVDGHPYTCQFSDSQGGESLEECNGRPEVIRACIAEYLQKAPPKSFILMGAWYLRFDMQILFRDAPEIFSGLGEVDHQDEQGIHWKGSTNWPVIFAVARWKGRTLLLMDAWRYFQGTLAKTCEMLNLPIQKLPRPACIKEGRAPQGKAEREEFATYAMVDAKAVLQVMTLIDSLWAREDLGPCISLAHQAGRVFRVKHTLDQGKPKGLDAPDHFSNLNGLAAYHGGRNSLLAETLPLVVPDCALYDVRSLYPSICVFELPSFFQGRWVSDTRISKRPQVDLAGIYRVSGTLRAGAHPQYRLLMNAAGEYLPVDKPFKAWVSGFELQAALQYSLIEDVKVFGFHWEGGSKRHPFKDFYTEIFNQKEANRGKNSLLYHYYKNLGNSLTGKFVATIPQQDSNGQKFRVPGLLFNGPIGALITGAGRARLFRAEIASSSIHAATDSIVVPPWGAHPANIGPGMGQWEKVCTGVFVCARNKLYAFLGEKKGNFTGEKDGSLFWAGQKIEKYALHAFRGTVFQFLAAVFDGQREYSYQRMTQLREAGKRGGIVPLTMQTFTEKLNFGGKYAATK